MRNPIIVRCQSLSLPHKCCALTYRPTQIDEEQSSPVYNVTSNLPVQPVRSSSFNLGVDTQQMGGEDYSTSRGSNGDGSSPTTAQAGAGGKVGLKRTRSLLQRLRSMVCRIREFNNLYSYHFRLLVNRETVRTFLRTRITTISVLLHLIRPSARTRWAFAKLYPRMMKAHERGLLRVLSHQYPVQPRNERTLSCPGESLQRWGQVVMVYPRASRRYR